MLKTVRREFAFWLSANCFSSPSWNGLSSLEAQVGVQTSPVLLSKTMRISSIVTGQENISKSAKPDKRLKTLRHHQDIFEVTGTSQLSSDYSGAALFPRTNEGQMFKWLSGKLLLQNFHRDLRCAQETLSTTQARRCCEQLSQEIFRIKHAGKFGGDEEQRAIAAGRTLTSQILPAGWLKPVEPDHVARTLFDHWLSAKQAVMTREIAQDIFRLIDDELWSFTKGRLKPQEIEAIHLQVERSSLDQRRRSADQTIDELIKEYAEIGGAEVTDIDPLVPHAAGCTIGR